MASEVVPDLDRLHSGIRPYQHAHGLNGLREQSLDFSGDRSRGAVAALGEDMVALPSARELGQEQLVVAEADPDRRGRHAGGPRLSGDRCQAGRIELAVIRVPVGEQQHGRAGVARDPPRLLQPSKQASRKVRGPSRLERRDGGARALLVCHPSRGEHDRHLVVEGDETKLVGRVEPIDQASERVLGRIEPLAGHRPAAIEHDLHGRGGS